MTYTDSIIELAQLDLPWGELNNCNILVTGGTGLIGSCLVDALMSYPQKNYNIYVIGRNQKRAQKLFSKYETDKYFHFICHSIEYPLDCKIDFHYIIHAASEASPSSFASNPVELIKTNIAGLSNLLDYGIVHNLKRFLYISSGEVYGEGDGEDFNENSYGYVDILKARSCYPSVKRLAETLCASYSQEYGLDFVVARPCHIYGPNFTENDSRVYAQFIRNVLRGEDIVLKSSGEQLRSWCYVVDCVSALLYILLNGDNCQAYNIADPSSTVTIKELAEIISKIGKRKVIYQQPSEIEKKGYNIVTKSVFSIDKIEALGWSVSGTLQEKLQITINSVIK